MSVDQNKAILRQLVEAINSGNFDAFDTLVADDFKEHVDIAGSASGRDGFRGMMQGMRAVFPDFTIEHQVVIGEGDMLSYRMTASGTQQAEFAGIPPTGRRINFRGMEMMRFENGQAVERWGEIDQLGMLQQLGAFPPGNQ